MRHQGTKRAILIAAFAVVAFVATTHSAHAALFSLSDFVGLNVMQFINQVLAMIVNVVLQIMGFLLAISGMLLNLSIKLTLNIRSFVDSAPAVYTTWHTIRDISGMFLIFFLIYASIQLILGIESPQFKSTIKNIVLVGVLINFSFFFTSLGIDVSNVVSVQIYNAIAPAGDLAKSGDTLSSQSALMATLSSGASISNLFMNALQLPRLYQPSIDQTASALGSNGTGKGVFSDTVKIMLVGAIGILVTFTAMVSFTAAAFAFVLRFVFLIFLLAFSPIMFMDVLAPEIAEYTNQWKKMYKSMLLFMPIYLLLMYLAMNILTTTPLFQNPNAPISASATVPTSPQTGMVETALAQTASAGGGKPWYMDYVMLAVNAVIILFFINMPLVAAASIAGKGSKFLEKSMSTIRNSAHQWGSRLAYQGTVGRATSKIAQSEGFKNFAANWKVGEYALKGTRAAAAGYDKKLSAQVKSRTDFAESLGQDQRRVNAARANLRNLQQQLTAARAANNQPLVAQTELQIRMARQGMAQIESARKDAYSARINTSSIDTLYTKTARKDKVAAAKINIGIWEKTLNLKKDDLKDVRADIKQIEAAVRNQNGVANPQQTADLTRLRGREALLVRNPAAGNNIQLMGVDDLQDLIEQAKLTT